MNGFTSLSGDRATLTADGLIRCCELLARVAPPKGPIAIGVSFEMKDVLQREAEKSAAASTTLSMLFYGIELIDDPRLRGQQSIPVYTAAGRKRYLEEIAANLPLNLSAA